MSTIFRGRWPGGCAPRIFSYTNHTLMPEALETWPVALLERVLPRHLKIIYEINERFLDQVRSSHPGDDRTAAARVDHRREPAAGACAWRTWRWSAATRSTACRKLHSQLMQETIFADFDRLFPGRFVNCTNGITPRRWLALANPGLSALDRPRTSARTGAPSWNCSSNCAPLADDPDFIADFQAVKSANKQRLAGLRRARRPAWRSIRIRMFDVQIKRIHEYKRQLLNVLHVITRYNRIRADPQRDWVPRTVIFGGKAALGLLHGQADHQADQRRGRRSINADPRVGGRLKVVFVPNYGVSVAELIIPAADLSEQISTAGTEASGTGNMKLALNGALTIGTEDGANIEIRDAVGADNIFIFGLHADEVRQLRDSGYRPRDIYDAERRIETGARPDRRRRFFARMSRTASCRSCSRCSITATTTCCWPTTRSMWRRRSGRRAVCRCRCVDGAWRSAMSPRWGRSRAIAPSANTRPISGASVRSNL